MINVLVAIMGVAPVVMILICCRMALRKNSKLLALVLGLTAVHESALIALPAVASAFTDFKLEKEMSAAIDPSELAVVLFGEILFVAVFSTTLGLLLKRKGRRAEAASFQNNSAHHLTATILILIGIFLLADDLIHPTGFADYAGELEGTLERSTPQLIFAWVKNLFWFPSIAVAAVIFVKGKRDRYPRLAWVGASIVLFELVLVGFTAGVRGRVVTVACLIAALAVFNRRRMILVYILAATAVFLPFSAVLPGAVRAVRFSVAQQGGTSMDILPELPALFGAEADQFGAAEFFDETMWRAQGPRNSAILYRLYDDGDGAGLTPHLGALAFFVPRLFWPEKPAAGSSDGTFRGQAMYLVMGLGYESSETTMGPFLASAEAYWEIGWAGVILSAIVTALFWYGVVTLANRLGGVLSIAVPIMFACSLLIDGIPTAFMPVFSLITFVWKALLPTLAVYFVARSTTSILRSRGPQLGSSRLSAPRPVFANGPGHVSVQPD